MNHLSTINPSQRRGSSLVLVLATFMLVGTILLMVAGTVRNRARFTASESSQHLARSQAESALTILRVGAPHLRADDPLLHRRNPDGSGWDVNTLSENAKINFQYGLRGGDTSRIIGQLTRLSVDVETADIYASSAADWIDDDDFARLKGAEIDYYQAQGRDAPPNGPMQTIDELRSIRGFTEFATLVPDWEQIYTIHSSGRIDVNSAPARVFTALFGFDEEQARSLAARPLGPDGIRDSADDLPYESVADFARIAGLRGATSERYDFLTITPDTLRVEITAWTGEEEILLSALLDLRSSPATVLQRRWISPDRRTIVDGTVPSPNSPSFLP